MLSKYLRLNFEKTSNVQSHISSLPSNEVCERDSYLEEMSHSLRIYTTACSWRTLQSPAAPYLTPRPLDTGTFPPPALPTSTLAELTSFIPSSKAGQEFPP